MEEKYFDATDIISMTLNKSNDGTYSVNIITDNNGIEKHYFIPKLQLYPNQTLVKHDLVKELRDGTIYHGSTINFKLSSVALAVKMEDRNDGYYIKITEYEKI
jgi:hypothetical protein